MKLIIDMNSDGSINDVQTKGGSCGLAELCAVFFSIMEGTTKDCLEKTDEEGKDMLYEHFNGLFELFLRNTFPEPPEGYFELSDAALIFAQDKIIDEAEKKGLSFEEALRKYESRAKEYVRQKKEGLS